MFRRKIEVPTNKVVWRVTAADPVGVDIDLSELTSEAKALLEMPDRGWLESSRDLQQGLRVREMPMEALPRDLIKALLSQRDA
jgi:hypothetical protein